MNKPDKRRKVDEFEKWAAMELKTWPGSDFNRWLRMIRKEYRAFLRRKGKRK